MLGRPFDYSTLTFHRFWKLLSTWLWIGAVVVLFFISWAPFHVQRLAYHFHHFYNLPWYCHTIPLWSRFIQVSLQVSHFQPVPDVCVRLLVLPLIHVEPDLVQPDELEVQEGLQDHPALCSSAKPKGRETQFFPLLQELFCKSWEMKYYAIWVR